MPLSRKRPFCDGGCSAIRKAVQVQEPCVCFQGPDIRRGIHITRLRHHKAHYKATKSEAQGAIVTLALATTLALEIVISADLRPPADLELRAANLNPHAEAECEHHFIGQPVGPTRLDFPAQQRTASDWHLDLGQRSQIVEASCGFTGQHSPAT